MAAARGAEFAVEAEPQQRVVVRVGLEVDAASRTAVPTGGAAARDILLPAEGDAAVAAVAGLDIDFGFVNKHCCLRSV